MFLLLKLAMIGTMAASSGEESRLHQALPSNSLALVNRNSCSEFACHHGVSPDHLVPSTLSQDINIDAKDLYGRTLIFLAAKNGHFRAIKALEALGADVDLPDNLGRTPIHIAAKNGHIQAIKALIELGAAVDLPDNSGRTPIYAAVQKSQFLVVKALLAEGAKVERFYKGETLLSIAATKGDAEIVDALLKAGANKSIKTKRGTALKCAKRERGLKHKMVIELLQN